MRGEMLLYMLQAWFVFDQQLTRNTPLHNLYFLNNQMFPIYESLVESFMYQLHLHNSLKWSLMKTWIYVGFDSPSIIKYLEPLTGDAFIDYFTDCHFNESVFPPLWAEKLVPEEQREIT